MKTRPIYDNSLETTLAIPLYAHDLLEQNEGRYDDNWIVSAGDLFDQMELPNDNPYDSLAA